MMAAAEGTLGTLGTSGPPQPLECSGSDPHSMGWAPIPVLRQFVLSLVVDPGSTLPTGVLVPVPGPPLLGAAAGLAGAVPIPYPLDESRGWALDVAALRRELRDARGRCRPTVLCVVNPGDPTGGYGGTTRELGLEPDRFFCQRLEEDTGLVLLPGSHFGHRGGTHLGLSLLLPPATLERDLLLLTRFHAQFLQEFS
ncbi:hypothetical protein WISP_98879 [Willisornis vidua]|uniref:alanine transaminase n=1 Tax=Willisornis vidua TaxID=1566151 RepID=A0ABQ9D424_9PASS|nr:hypothetical protein WISP_98879 [Willisornis vidua]